jgi:hypothetical protein
MSAPASSFLLGTTCSQKTVSFVSSSAVSTGLVLTIPRLSIVCFCHWNLLKRRWLRNQGSLREIADKKKTHPRKKSFGHKGTTRAGTQVQSFLGSSAVTLAGFR